MAEVKLGGFHDQDFGIGGGDGRGTYRNCR